MCYRKTVFLSILICTVLFLSFSVSANNSTLTVYVSNGDAYTSIYDYSTISGVNHGSGYVRLDGFVFNGWTPNQMPYDGNGNYYVIHARLYTMSLTKASNVVHFTSQGTGLSCTYLSGYGGVGTSYRLKTNSSYSGTYSADFYWYA